MAAHRVNYKPRTGPGIQFPPWVTVTRCSSRTNSYTVHTRHGAVRVEHTR